MSLRVKEVRLWAGAERCADGGDLEVITAQSSRTSSWNYYILMSHSQRSSDYWGFERVRGRTGSARPGRLDGGFLQLLWHLASLCAWLSWH